MAVEIDDQELLLVAINNKTVLFQRVNVVQCFDD